MESRHRNPLNVVVEKVGATRALVHGDVSVESLKELLISSLSLLPKTRSKKDDDKEFKKSDSKDGKKGSKDHEKDDPAHKYTDKKKPTFDSDKSSAKNERMKKNGEKTKSIKKKNKKNKIGEKLGANFVEQILNFQESSEREEEDEEIEDEEAIGSLKSCTSGFSIEKSPLSNDGRWLRSHFEKPLVLGLKDVVKIKPQDPVGYLAFWLRKYRNEEESRRRKSELDKDLEKERALITSEKFDEGDIKQPEYDQNDADGEEGGGRADLNFQNYYSRGLKLN